MAVQRAQGITRERWERIKSIFEAALEQPACDRSSFVAKLCAEDQSLRSEVESLLARHGQVGSFMAAPAVAAMATDSDAASKERTFQPGDLLSGRFEILSFIAEGGMGEVYAAHDSELGINVALKTIRPEIASDRNTLVRFKQELHLSRRITHPNVCRVFDLAHHRIPKASGGPDRDVTYLTMELLEGETLAERLRRGRMSPAEALPLIQQMADGLEAAHSVGVIHRDFKPSNVLLCTGRQSPDSEPAVRAVITDFGLAHSFYATDASASLTQSGQLLGTLAYMAPEQVEGKEVTPATDIYALGLVIYEMVTGVRPFPGDGPLGGVIQRLQEPAPSPRIIAPGVDLIWEATILRCLQPEPVDRFARAGEIVGSLQSSSPSSFLRHSFKARLLRLRTWSNPKRLYVAGGGLFLLVLAMWFLRDKTASSTNAGPAPPMRLEMTQFTADGGVTFQPSVSADGTQVAYSSDRDGSGILNVWIQPAKGGPARQVTHESFDAIEPDLSSDGSRIVFRSEGDGRIFIILADGTGKREVAPNGHQPRFSPDGTKIVFWSGDWLGDLSNPSFIANSKIFVTSSEGGTPHAFQEHFADARLPTWLPDGKHILFLGTNNPVGSAMDVSDWWIGNLGDPQEPPAKTGAFEAIRSQSVSVQDFAPEWWDNSIIFSGRSAQTTNLFRLRISPETFRVVGEPERLTLGAGYETTPSISARGRLFFTSAIAPINVWSVRLAGTDSDYKAAGVPIQLTSAASTDTRPSVSHDGTKLVFARRWGEERNVWVRDLKDGKETQLTSSAIAIPVISRDGSKVAYSVRANASRAIIEVLPLTGGQPKTVCSDCGDPLDWTSDDSGLLYSSAAEKSISLLELSSGRKTVVLRPTESSSLTSASFCPKDECIAFNEILDGSHSKLWLAPIHSGSLTPREEWIPLTNGLFDDDKPRWSSDGKWLYFYSNRDGFGCIWKLRVDSAMGRTGNKPQPFLHLHRSNFTLRELSRPAFDFRVAKDKIVFNAVSYAANIWKTDLARN